jgi:Protein of unknown function (DUF2778)
MSWIYEQATGKLGHDGDFVGTCYSGNGAGVNNPEFEDVHNVGPIPRGEWTIWPAMTYEGLGPMAMKLTPANGTSTFGRSGFYIHGDNVAGNESASHGCIVAPHDIRVRIADSGDNMLQVV